MQTIIINAPIMQSKIQSIVEQIESINCKLIKKDGIKLYFEIDYEDKEEACSIIKKEMKKDPIAQTIMFNVMPEEY